MKYECEITIALERDKVIELMDNSDNLKKWQDGLIKIEQLSGIPGENGAKMLLEYQTRGKKMEMIETILENNFPDTFSASYEAKGVFNILHNTFWDDGGMTRWKQENEFRMKGVWGLLGKFMKSVFVKQTLSDMNKFKNFAEEELKEKV